MPITINRLQRSIANDYDYDDHRYIQEEMFNRVSETLLAECQNRDAVACFMKAVRLWEVVPFRGCYRLTSKDFKEYCRYKRAVCELVDGNDGAIRAWIEKGIKAIHGEQPQHLMDKSIEEAAMWLNMLADYQPS